MVEKDYHQVLSVFIELGAKIDVQARSKETLLQVAFRKKYPKTIKVLLSHIDKHTKYIKDAMKVTQMIYSDTFIKDDKKKEPISPLLLL